MPATAEQLTTYIHATLAPARLVIWLNETQDYLGSSGLTAATVRRILTSPQPTIIIGTVWPSRYDTLTGRLPASRPADAADATPAPDSNRDAREILTILADRKDLPADLTPAEQQRAENLAPAIHGLLKPSPTLTPPPSLRPSPPPPT